MKGEKRNGHSYWTVHPFCKVVDNTPANRESEPLTGGEGPEVDGTEGGDTIEVEGPSIANREANSENSYLKQRHSLLTLLAKDMRKPLLR